MKVWGSLLLALGSLAAGYVLGAAFRPAVSRAAPTRHAVAASPVPPASFAPPQPVPGPINSPAKYGRSHLEVLSELQRLMPGKYNVRPISAGELHDDFAVWYDLTPEEADQLRAALARAKTKLAEVSAQQAVFKRNDDGSLAVTIPEPGDQARPVLDAWMNDLSAVMGPARFEYFRSQLSPEELTSFSPAGASWTRTETHLTVRMPTDRETTAPSWTYTREEGRWRLSGESPLREFRQNYPLVYARIVREGVLLPID